VHKIHVADPVMAHMKPQKMQAENGGALLRGHRRREEAIQLCAEQKKSPPTSRPRHGSIK